MELRVLKLHPDATLPTFAHDTDAGMDLYCAEAVTIQEGSYGEVHTGIAVAIPKGHVGLIWDKSGLSRKHGLTILGGVVDEGYTGELIILMHNVGQDDFTFAVKDKVTQMLVQSVAHPRIVEVTSLDETERGEKGFGSSGT